MAKIPFDIKYRPQIESGEYKVETRDGRAARITCWDLKHGAYVIVAAIQEGCDECSVELYTDKGFYWTGDSPCGYDLFLITTEPVVEETEDERARKEIYGFLNRVLKDKNVLLLIADRIGDDVPNMIPGWISYIEKQKEQKPADIDLETLVIELEETIGTSPHSREAIKEFFQKALNSFCPLPHWKPSNLEHGALRTAISVLTEERNFQRAGKHLQDILDHFEGKETRHDWKPSKEQIDAVYHACNRVVGDRYHAAISSLYDDLKKLM